jgi:voltage-gated potassium channel
VTRPGTRQRPRSLGPRVVGLRLSTMPQSGSRFRRRLITYVVVAGFLVLLTGGAFAAFESRQVSSYWEGLWWALSLMSTVGFIGEAPESAVGRLVSSVLMVSGFALMAMVTAAIASLFVREEQEPEEQAQELFDAEALRMLTDIARRLDAIETTLAPNAAPEPDRTPTDEDGSSTP